MYDIKTAFSWNVLELMKQQNKSWGDIADCYEVDIPTAKEFIFRRMGYITVETLEKFAKLFNVKELNRFYDVEGYTHDDDIDGKFVEKVKREYSKEEYRIIMKSRKKTITHAIMVASQKDLMKRRASKLQSDNAIVIRGEFDE